MSMDPGTNPAEPKSKPPNHQKHQRYTLPGHFARLWPFWDGEKRWTFQRMLESWPTPEASARYTEQLPKVIDESKWMANRLTVEQVLSPSRSKESEQRCMTRLEDPPEVCRQLLMDLREGPALWQGLRKHLTVEDSEFILRVLQEHSDWRVVKKRSEWKTPTNKGKTTSRLDLPGTCISHHFTVV